MAHKGGEIVIHLWGGDYEVRISLHRRPYPASDEAWDRDAISATVTAIAGTFRAHVTTTIWSHELVHLQQLLNELERGIGQEIRASWPLIEPELLLTFESDRFGHIEIRVEMRDLYDEKRLQFSLNSDQTYLPAWSNDVSQALQAFPPELGSSLS